MISKTELNENVTKILATMQQLPKLCLTVGRCIVAQISGVLLFAVVCLWETL